MTNGVVTMSITTESKKDIIGEFATKENDTGSPEVQVAILNLEFTALRQCVIMCGVVLFRSLRFRYFRNGLQRNLQGRPAVAPRPPRCGSSRGSRHVSAFAFV